MATIAGAPPHSGDPPLSRTSFQQRFDIRGGRPHPRPPAAGRSREYTRSRSNSFNAGRRCISGKGRRRAGRRPLTSAAVSTAAGSSRPRMPPGTPRARTRGTRPTARPGAGLISESVIVVVASPGLTVPEEIDEAQAKRSTIDAASDTSPCARSPEFAEAFVIRLAAPEPDNRSAE